MFETEESEAHRRIGVDNTYDLLKYIMNQSIEETSR